MSNPTSNYSFQMPTAADLVTDLPADFEVFGQAVDTQMKTNADAATQKATLTTTGDIYYASAANTPARRAIGTTGQILTVSGGVPVWSSPAGGGGKILQVVSAVTTTETNIASTSMTDTTITATITPTSATSQILVLITASTYLYVGAATGRNVSAQILRGATNVYNRSSSGWEIKNLQPNTGTWLAQEYGNSYALSCVDSPATTSATTYKLQAKIDSTSGSSSIYFQLSNNPSTIILMEVGA